MDPRALKQLAIVIRYGSIKRASEHLEITHPTLTRAIKQLEKDSGGVLLVRSKHGVKATKLGTRMSIIGEQIIAQEQAAMDLAENWQHDSEGEILIGAAPLISLSMGYDVINHLMVHTNYRISLEHAVPYTLLSQLNAGELDIAIAPANVNISQKNLIRKPCFGDKLGLFVGKKSALLGSQDVLPDEVLKEQNWMLTGVGSELIGTHQAPLHFGASRVRLNGSTNTMIDMLTNTDFCVVVPKKLMLNIDQIQRQQLVETEYKWPTMDFAVWVNKDKLASAAIKDVSEHLETFFKNLNTSL